MEFLNHCELLKIEDILPFFQDFVTIDHFKVSGSSLLTLSLLASNHVQWPGRTRIREKYPLALEGKVLDHDVTIFTVRMLEFKKIERVLDNDQ